MMPEQIQRNRPGTAAVLSFVFNGAGQLYNGQITKGLILILLSVASIAILIFGSALIAFWLLGRQTYTTEGLVGFLLFTVALVASCIVGIYSIRDAYNNATKI